MPDKPQFFITRTPASLEPHVAKLIEQHREELIKASIPDPEVQSTLLQINGLIDQVKARDPSQVAAWGLGCGGHCAAPVGSLEEIITLSGR